jgi:hypothetical protein
LTLRVHQCRDNAESAPPVRAMQNSHEDDQETL